ncbi:hypothetical protein FSARC_9113 [Fusarium sarcochroum]|uniref:Rhodopsin domain-containing protein n=1 Tax=Fusarium sarcochroum TaxID=1208366 RepID=A0A8H4TRM2_9HYPO|nr:hypothetical protein FSARC_9113 [Fusarium sarcochroum]
MALYPVINGVTAFLSPPEGYVVDFQHPQQRDALKHYLVFADNLRIDDVLISMAWVASLAMQSVQIWSISIGGLCHHAWEMPIDVFEKHMLSSYIAAPIFITCNGLSKTSLLTTYLQISPQKWFKATIFATIFVVFSYTITIALLLLFGCRPIRTAWDPYQLPNGKCVDNAVLYIAIAVANIVSDLGLFFIPIPMIARLKMPSGQKIGAAIMFGIGSMTVATSIIRMVYLPSLLGAADIPWVAAPANVWSFVEVNLFVICASMPTFRRFLKRFAPRWMGSSSHSHSSKPMNDQSISRLRRRSRTRYGKFDGFELETYNYDNERDDPGTGTMTLEPMASQMGANMPMRTALCNSSEEAILNGKPAS